MDTEWICTDCGKSFCFSDPFIQIDRSEITDPDFRFCLGCALSQYCYYDKEADLYYDSNCWFNDFKNTDLRRFIFNTLKKQCPIEKTFRVRTLDEWLKFFSGEL